MLLDALLMFDPQGTAITVTAVSTNFLDLSEDRDLGGGHLNLDILVLIQAAFTAAGAATLVCSLQGAVDNGSGAPGTYYDFILTGVLPVANLTAGRTILRVPMPRKQPAASNVDTPPRFLQLKYTVATGPMTAGTVFSAIIPSTGRQDNYAYPSGFTPYN